MTTKEAIYAAILEYFEKEEKAHDPNFYINVSAECLSVEVDGSIAMDELAEAISVKLARSNCTPC